MKIKNTVVALASLFIALSANASVTYDENGVGFVGKGDIQSLFDWNNSQLQENAGALQFRFISEGTITWKCERYTGDKLTKTTYPSTSTSVDAGATLDSRKNKKGMITGFNLEGMDINSNPEYANVGECSGPGQGQSQGQTWVLVEGSIQYVGSESPLLQVMFAPAAESGLTPSEWMDLPITE
ncbi:hypothetical protein [Shewanella sp. Isolate11]|uniref:hypothetical protein n=1 Tax=Shewanella sp. Isolate11 TaxID=2908530 RepID=UPI001EFCC1A8|nr:hypothetical protein [Shewanella sp. Isolate11]MCG9698156.1 hypothetical protein [Shewanella sp. Isolate11]